MRVLISALVEHMRSYHSNALEVLIIGSNENSTLVYLVQVAVKSIVSLEGT